MKSIPLASALLLAFSLPALAGSAPSHAYGAVARGYFTAHGRFGNFYGLETRLMHTGPLFLGVSGFGGPVLNAPQSALGYGGGVAGLGVTLPGGWYVASRLWAGGGGGRLDGESLGALSVEPSISLGGPVAPDVIASFSLGYLAMLGQPDLRGLVIAFRADL